MLKNLVYSIAQWSFTKFVQMKVPGSKIVPCQGVLGSNHSLTFGLFTQVSGSGPLGPLVCGDGSGVGGRCDTPLRGILVLYPQYLLNFIKLAWIYH